MYKRQVEEVHLSLAGLEQQNAFILENVSRIEEEIEKFSAELKELDVNKGNAAEDIEKKEKEIKELKDTIENSKDLFAEIETEIRVQVKKREELNQKHKDFLEKREELSKHMADLDKECFRLNSQKAVSYTHLLLKACKDIHFIGSVEARDIPYGAADVLVCEAFVGNVILKLYEGVGAALVKKIKKGMMSSMRSKIGALLVKPALKATLKDFDSSEHGGAPLLGLNGLVVKTHGSSTSKEICNSIIQCLT